MELSYFLAQLMGLVLVVYAVALLYKPAVVKKLVEEVSVSDDFALFASVMGIVPGLAVILSHNVWVMGWPVIITIFGWAALFKGVAFLVAPASLMTLGRFFYSSRSKTRLVLFIMLLFGLCLAGIGFKII